MNPSIKKDTNANDKKAIANQYEVSQDRHDLEDKDKGIVDQKDTYSCEKEKE